MEKSKEQIVWLIVFQSDGKFSQGCHQDHQR